MATMNVKDAEFQKKLTFAKVFDINDSHVSPGVAYGGTIVRKHWVGSDNYDIVITWYSEPKMISWYFCKSYEYAIA